MKIAATVALCMTAAALAVAGVSGAAEKDHAAKGGKEQGRAHKQEHVDGARLLGENLKKNGRHKLDKRGPAEASVDVRDGKITAFHVKHDQKGDLPVHKYKSTRKMASAGVQPVALRLAQSGTQYMGQTWIGYSYYDDYGNEVIYWFPYDMIYDYDTGATEYVPAY